MEHARIAARTEQIDGLLLAAVDQARPWQAVRDLRSAMRELRAAGASPATAFVVSLARDGRMVPASDPRSAVLILGFRAPGLVPAGRRTGSFPATAG